MTAADTSGYVQANWNGQLGDARQPMIAPLDRGFLYGDAIYEVWRSYDGVLFAVAEHWERLEQTAQGVGLELPFERDFAFAEIFRTVEAWRAATGSRSEVYVRLQISRGGGPIGLDTALADEPAYAILVKAQPNLSSEALARGVSLAVPKIWRRNAIETLSPALKTGNYLNNVLGLREARSAGADDCLFLNQRGRIAEASTRNVWFVFADRIATPALSDGLLAGVTRRLLLDFAGDVDGRPLTEESLTLADVEMAEECFLSSTTQDVQPVSSLDERSFALGPDTVARRLKTRFAELVKDYVAANPQWRV